MRPLVCNCMASVFPVIDMPNLAFVDGRLGGQLEIQCRFFTSANDQFSLFNGKPSSLDNDPVLARRQIRESIAPFTICCYAPGSCYGDDGARNRNSAFHI